MKIVKYEVLDEIGRGAMGVVYKAFDPLIDRIVAVKVISESALTLPEIKERFYREARSVGKLSHENITILHDVGEVEGKPYLVMEHLPGIDLKAIIREKAPVPLLQKLEYARQICKGLEYAHAQNLIHRDIKPENIKVLPDGKVKIMDFGIARPVVSELTTSGMMLGTPWYMSPEQITGKAIDHRTDIFSFGVVLYELLMYQKPFGGTASTVIYSALHDQPAPLHLAESYLVADMQNLLTKCLAKSADDRYRDCAELIEDLDKIIAKARQQEQKVAGLLAQAKALFTQQKFQETLPLLDEILLLDSTSGEALTLRQQCLEQTKTTTVAVTASPTTAGTIISRYRILGRLNAGGMGVLYKAEDMRLKRQVALKFLSPHLTADVVAKERFIREAQAASALDHPNICTIYEIDESTTSPSLQFLEGGSQLFICMAYYEGQTLKEKMAEGSLPLETTTSLAIQIAEGLAKAHENGIVHRDIKPANIMITKDGLVKILDFGLAKLTGETRLTRSGMTAGTLGYLSPEQTQNHEVDHRSDIWSLGVMLYQMATGKLPFDGDYELAILYAIVHEEPAPVLQLNPEIPIELAQLISRATQKKVEARFATMKEMLEELQQIQRRYFGKRDHEATPLTAEIGSLVAKGKFLLASGEYAEALSRFKAALALEAGNVEVTELIAECERRQKEARQINKLLETAQKHFDKGAYESSLTAVLNVLQLAPDHPEAKNWEAKIKQRLEQTESVEKLFSDAEFYLRKEKFAQAREAFQEILKLEPANKNAARGLERAERALQGRKSDTTTYQITQIDKTRVLPVAKSKASGKGLWIGLSALVLMVAVAGAWLLLPEPGTQAVMEEATTPPDFAHKAQAVKQDMLQAKTDAQQAGAERWSPHTFQRAGREEQRGDQEAAKGSWEQAAQAYETATGLFKQAAQEASENVAVADLDSLKSNVAQARQAMLDEKMLAEKGGASVKSKTLYDHAVYQEQEGNRAFAVNQRSYYISAQKLFEQAKLEYRRARQETLALVQAAENAEAARQAMLTAKRKIPGDEAGRNTSVNYAKAETSADQGNRQLQDGHYEGARISFERAEQFYSAVESELGANALKSRAESTRTAMLEARSKVDKSLGTDALYLKGEQTRAEGDRALLAEEFPEAIGRYAAAKDLYEAVVNQTKEGRTQGAEQEAIAQREIQALIDRFKAGLEQRDLQTVKAVLGKTFMKVDENAWTNFFKRAREIRAQIDARPELNGNDASVELKIHLRFFNTSNNDDNQSEFAENWLLKRNNGSWSIAERKPR